MLPVDGCAPTCTSKNDHAALAFLQRLRSGQFADIRKDRHDRHSQLVWRRYTLKKSLIHLHVRTAIVRNVCQPPDKSLLKVGCPERTGPRWPRCTNLVKGGHQSSLIRASAPSFER